MFSLLLKDLISDFLFVIIITFQNCKKSKAELEMMKQNVEDGDTTEIHDNIQFYDENIQGITIELEMLKGKCNIWASSRENLSSGLRPGKTQTGLLSFRN